MKSQHEKLIVLDFDHTIFNTTLFLEDIKRHFQEVYAIDPDVFDATRKYLKGMETMQDMKTLVEHLPHPDNDSMHKAIMDIATHAEHLALHADVMPFIDRHKDAFDIVILTYGERQLQEAKIQGTGLKIPHVVVQGSKADAFEEWTNQYKEIFFVDDKAKNIDEVKEKYPGVVAYFIRRPDDQPYGEKLPMCECADKIVEDLHFTLI